MRYRASLSSSMASAARRPPPRTRSACGYHPGSAVPPPPGRWTDPRRGPRRWLRSGRPGASRSKAARRQPTATSCPRRPYRPRPGSWGFCSTVLHVLSGLCAYTCTRFCTKSVAVNPHKCHTLYIICFLPLSFYHEIRQVATNLFEFLNFFVDSGGEMWYACLINRYANFYHFRKVRAYP